MLRCKRRRMMAIFWCPCSVTPFSSPPLTPRALPLSSGASHDECTGSLLNAIQFSRVRPAFAPFVGIFCFYCAWSISNGHFLFLSFAFISLLCHTTFNTLLSFLYFFLSSKPLLGVCLIKRTLVSSVMYLRRASIMAGVCYVGIYEP